MDGVLMTLQPIQLRADLSNAVMHHLLQMMHVELLLED